MVTELLSNNCLKCGTRFKSRKLKNKIDVLYCIECAKEKKDFDKLNKKINTFIRNNPFKKFHIKVLKDNYKNPTKIIIDFTRKHD